ncbi:MAG: HIRAN domain-containing protein [Thiohalocapsa sp.]|uniref:HIRAN domain-containing protein n=1 Tax=Thiohalocapsa sp. TaxID=2497641 RepID=UPI0025F01C17|nr:HIRAN domain-containing protein [Thiohalocapsa sp.]
MLPANRPASQRALRLNPVLSAGPPAARVIRLQRSALAGFRHHEAPQLWPALARRTPLTLEREADNPHDANAVALRWRGRKLGYLPRGENLMAARLLDRQRQLCARIERLDPNAEHNARIGIEVILC